MTLVEFPDSAHYEFAAQIVAPQSLTSDDGAAWGAKRMPSHLAIAVERPIIGQLLKRIADGRPMIVPYAGVIHNRQRAWLVAAATTYELDRTLTHISRLLVPTYASYTNGAAYAHIQTFRADSKNLALQRLGAQVYPAGYFSLRSPERFTDTILQRLEVWLGLEERQRIIPYHRKPTYRELLDTFQGALAARNWPEADTALGELRQRGLTSADNLSFLDVQSLARQERWTALWAREDYADIARLRMPSAVREALLTAFHHSVLLPLEQEARWDDALEMYRQSRDKLGLLVTGRFGLTQPPVLRVFAYQSVLEANHTELATLRALDDTKDSRSLYDHLSHLIAHAPPPVEPPLPQSIAPAAAEALSPSLAPLQTATTLQRARQALFDGDFDAVIQAAHEIDDGEQRALLLIEVASYSGDVSTAMTALETFWDLPPERQDALQRDNAFLNTKLQILYGVVEPHDPPEPELSIPQVDIQTWPEWFAHALTLNTDETKLRNILDQLVAGVSDNFFATPTLHALNQQLLETINAPGAVKSNLVSAGLRKLTDVALNDAAFPRDDDECAELYETLYAALLDAHQVNETNSMQLMRLAEARLRRSPQRVTDVYRHLADWFSHPMRALEDQLFDAFDLLSDYGLPSGLLADLCRKWVDTTLQAPKGRDRDNLQSWLAFVDWIQPGADISTRLSQALTQLGAQAAEDPLALLPAGYRIGIFTLRHSSAERAKEMLLKYNAHLDIRICLEQDLNGPAKAIATNSNLVVVVTTCVTHALTYGIEPYLSGKQPVYPVSSGSISMFRAIVDRLRSDRA